MTLLFDLVLKKKKKYFKLKKAEDTPRLHVALVYINIDFFLREFVL